MAFKKINFDNIISKSSDKKLNSISNKNDINREDSPFSFSKDLIDHQFINIDKLQYNDLERMRPLNIIENILGIMADEIIYCSSYIKEIEDEIQRLCENYSNENEMVRNIRLNVKGKSLYKHIDKLRSQKNLIKIYSKKYYDLDYQFESKRQLEFLNYIQNKLHEKGDYVKLF